MPVDPPHPDIRFGPIRHALTSMAPEPVDPPWAPEHRQTAAVAVVLRNARDLDVLLIKRATSERDPWSGQMALPGGRRDAADTSLRHTAIRETHEEVGLDLGLHARPYLGRMDALRPGTKRLPIDSITPFVFGVHGRADAVVASHEVADIFWIPLIELADPASRSTVKIPLPEGPRSFPCYRVAGQVIWGLTHRILSQFLVIHAASADLPAPRAFRPHERLDSDPLEDDRDGPQPLQRQPKPRPR